MAESTVKELKEALAAKQAELKTFVDNGIKVDGPNVQVEQKDYKYVQEQLGEQDQIRTLIKAAEYDPEKKEAGIEQSGPMNSAAMRAALGAGVNMPGQSLVKSLGEAFTGSDEFKAFRKEGGTTMRNSWEVKAFDISKMGGHVAAPGFATGEDGEYGQKDVVTGSVPPVSTIGFGRTQWDPMIPRQQRAYRVRDLFPVSPTNANLIDYFKVLGFIENGGRGNAGTVPEQTGIAPNQQFGLKPKSNLQFAAAQAPIRTIAHWEAAHRNLLDDEPQLQAVINNELLYGLALTEDDQILNGDGNNENLLGILNTPDIQLYQQGSNPGDKKSDALRRAATLSIIANYPATGYVLHPNDWEDIELQKGTGDGQYMLFTNIAIGLAAQVWRQPVVETPAMNEGVFLTGAFGLATQLYDRQVANVRVAEQHADFFVRNAIAVLVEERLGIATKRPEAMIRGEFQ